MLAAPYQPAIPLSTQETARTFLEARLGRPVSAQEFALWRSRLVGFVRLLRSWEEQQMSSRSHSNLG